MRQHYPPEGFTERLNEAINKSGLSMTVIKERLQISWSCLYSYIHGYTTPSVKTLASLCRLLHVSADWLLFGKEVTKKCNT